MGFSAGRAIANTSVTLAGTIPAPGSAPENTLRDPSTAPVGGVTQTLSYGTSSGEADVFCDGEFILAAGASLTLNLYNGSTTRDDLTTLFGSAANLRTVKLLSVAVKDGGDTSGVAVGGASSNEWVGFFSTAGDQVKIFPDGATFTVGSPDGVAVTSATKNLKLENLGAAEVVVQVMAAGTSVTVGTWTGFWGFLTYS